MSIGVALPRGEFDRSARKAQTRRSLLEAAARVYARAGFAGATLDEVAAEAGFTKGAVYAHFGSKENLLVALVDEHVARQLAEQVELFDRARVTWQRPLAGSASWMRDLETDPEPFRLFVELWAYAQRDERLRARLSEALAAMRATFARFAAASAADAGIESSQNLGERFGDMTLAFAMGLALIKLIDSERVPASLLGAVISVIVRAIESDAEVRELLNDPDRVLAVDGGLL